MDFSFVSSEDILINFFYLFQSEKSRFAPSDFASGFPNLGFGDEIPRTHINTFGLSFGKILNTKNNSVKFDLHGGILIGGMTTPCNFEPRGSTGWFDFGSNYTYQIKKDIIIGILINPKIDFIISKSFGLTSGICVNLNTSESTIECELGIIFGRLKEHKKIN